MRQWICAHCGEIYDEALGNESAPPGTRFEDLPDDWTCPICGATKDTFILLEE